MSNSGNANREHLKEKARLARALEASQGQVESVRIEPLFGRPRKISPAPHDTTAHRVNDVFGPYDLVQPLIQTKPQNYFGRSWVANSSTAAKGSPKVNGQVVPKKGDGGSHPDSSTKPVDPKQDGRSRKDSQNKSDRKSLGSQNDIGIKQERRSLDRDSHGSRRNSPEKKHKPSVEDLKKNAASHGDGGKKYNAKHGRQGSSDRESKHGRHRSVDPEQHRQKSAERDSSSTQNRRSLGGSVERESKRDDRNSVPRDSSEKRSASLDRSNNRDHSSQSDTTQKPLHRDGNIFTRLIKHEPEDGNSGHDTHSDASKTAIKDISKIPVEKGIPPGRSADRHRTESSSSNCSDNYPNASPKVKKEREDAKVKEGIMQPPNGVILKKRDVQKNLPKLKIEGKTGHDDKLPVEDILKEMKFEHPALTGIHTPRKEEGLKFPFSGSKDVAHVTKTLYQNRKPSVPLESPVKKEKNPRSDQLLQEDLALSDSDVENDEQVFPKKQESEHKSAKRPTSRSRSSSESSCNGSGSSSESESESGSSSDEAEEPRDTGQKEEEAKADDGKETWGLQNFFNQLNKSNSSLSPCTKLAAEPTPPAPPRPEPVNDGLDFDSWKDSWKHIRSVQEEVPPLIQRIDDAKDTNRDRSHASLFSTDDEDPGDELSQFQSEEEDSLDETNKPRLHNSGVQKSASPSVHTVQNVQINKNGGIKLKLCRKVEESKKQRTSSSSSVPGQENISETTLSAAAKSAKLKKQKSQPCLTQKSISNLVNVEPSHGPQARNGGYDSRKLVGSSTPKEDLAAKMVQKSVSRTKNSKVKSKEFLSSSESSDDDDDDDDDDFDVQSSKVPHVFKGAKSNAVKVEASWGTPVSHNSKDRPRKPVSKFHKERGTETKPGMGDVKIETRIKPESMSSYVGSHEEVNKMLNAISGDIDIQSVLSPIPNTEAFSPKRNFSFGMNSHDNHQNIANESWTDKTRKDSCHPDLQYQNSHGFSPKRKLSSNVEGGSSSAKRLWSYIDYTNEGRPSIKVHLNLSLIRRLPDSRLSTSSLWQELETANQIEDNVFVPFSGVMLHQMPQDAQNLNVPLLHSFEEGELSPSASPEEQGKLDSSSDSEHGMKTDNPYLPLDSIEVLPQETTDTSHDDEAEGDAHRMQTEAAEGQDEGEILDDSSPEMPTTSSGKVPFQAQKEKLSAQKNILSKIFGDRPTLPSQKIPKRKLEEVRQEDLKRQKQLHSKYQPSDVIARESISHEDDREWDRKHHRSRERRNSGSSTSSRHSSRSERDAKRSTKYDRDHDKYRDLDRERDQRDYVRDYEMFDRSKPYERRMRDWDAPSPPRHDSQSCGALNSSSGYRSAIDHWGAITTGGHVDRRSSYPNPADTFRLEEEKQETADHYLQEAKKLKHQADSLSDRLTKSLTYVEAVLSFIQCGNAMEHEHISDSGKIFTMYRDTLYLLRHICKFRTHTDSEVGDKERKLSVLSLRIQSLLCLKLFKLKKSEASKLRKAIEEHNTKTGPNKTPGQMPSPYQMQWNRSTGTPSPMSPTPSPASVSSVEPGSVNSDPMMPRLLNGHLNSTAYSSSSAMSSPASVSVPQRIHSVTQQYITTLNHLHQCHDLWDQADAQSCENKAFFDELDYHCGPLSLHSSILHLVKYVRLGLHRLKDT